MTPRGGAHHGIPWHGGYGKKGIAQFPDITNIPIKTDTP